MTKEEMKNRISMALKDPILQQGFEIICKNLAKLESRNDKLVKMYNERSEIDNSFQQSLYKNIEELEKENAELKEKNDNLVASSKTIISLSDEIETRTMEQLTKAKGIILKLYNAGRDVLMCRAEEKAYDNLEEAINDRSIEQFLKGVSE